MHGVYRVKHGSPDNVFRRIYRMHTSLLWARVYRVTEPDISTSSECACVCVWKRARVLLLISCSWAGRATPHRTAQILFVSCSLESINCLTFSSAFWLKISLPHRSNLVDHKFQIEFALGFACFQTIHTQQKIQAVNHDRLYQREKKAYELKGMLSCDACTRLAYRGYVRFGAIVCELDVTSSRRAPQKMLTTIYSLGGTGRTRLQHTPWLRSMSIQSSMCLQIVVDEHNGVVVRPQFCQIIWVCKQSADIRSALPFPLKWNWRRETENNTKRLNCA